MFCKSLIVFGLLAAFSVQGMEATQLSDRVDEVKQLITKLNEIVSGVIGDALKTLTNLIDTIKAIGEKFLNAGLTVIKETIDNALAFIASIDEEAANHGIDISKCTAGQQDQLDELATSLARALSDCVSEIVSAALEMVNNDLKIIGEIVKNITNVPVELTKCLISLRPISCVTDMIARLTKFVSELPGRISNLVNEARSLVAGLPGKLDSCVTGISTTANANVDAIIDDISKCVLDELIPE